MAYLTENLKRRESMERLRKRREELKLTQKQVAERIGIAERAYQRYEQTSRLPNVKIGIKIAKALETTVEELYGD